MVSDEEVSSELGMLAVCSFHGDKLGSKTYLVDRILSAEELRETDGILL